MKYRLVNALTCLLGLAAILFIAGCATGNKRITEQTRTKQIKIGETTKAEVFEILGKPKQKHKIQNKSEGKTIEVWAYVYVKEKFSAVDFATGGILGILTPAHTDSFMFVVIFSENGVVENIMQQNRSQ